MAFTCVRWPFWLRFSPVTETIPNRHLCRTTYGNSSAKRGRRGQVQFSPHCSNGKARQAAIDIVVCGR